MKQSVRPLLIPTMRLQLLVWLSLSPLIGLAADQVEISPAQQTDGGVLIHTIRSAYQSGDCRLRILPPCHLEPERRYPVIYLLPVEPDESEEFGDGLDAVHEAKLHDEHQVIFVAPGFSGLPWYADHPTDRKIRQESYFVKVVVPFIAKSYPVAKQPNDHHLLGFSKSGWGAWSLLLRHPDLFGQAAAWDAPLMMNRVGRFGSKPIFGTQENFEKYQVSRLVRERAEMLRQRPRLILTGYDLFRRPHLRMHDLLVQLQISHTHRDGPHRKHTWNSGWVPEAVELLLKHPPSESPPK